MSNIIGLPGSSSPSDRDETIIEILREVLAQAVRGEISTLALVTVDRERQSFNMRFRGNHLMAIGALSVLRAEIERFLLQFGQSGRHDR